MNEVKINQPPWSKADDGNFVGQMLQPLTGDVWDRLEKSGFGGGPISPAAASTAAEENLYGGVFKPIPGSPGPGTEENLFGEAIAVPEQPASSFSYSEALGGAVDWVGGALNFRGEADPNAPAKLRTNPRSMKRQPFGSARPSNATAVSEATILPNFGSDSW
jgi:hypothetical protein